MEFYNVKKRKKVKVADANCTRIVYKRKSKTTKAIQERFAVQAVDDDGVKLTRFVNKETFDKMTCPIAKSK